MKSYCKQTAVYFFIMSALLYLGQFSVLAQQQAKVKIVLIGTMHLTPSTSDLYKNKKIDLHTAAKQNEIREVVNKLAAFKPDQICLEYPMEYQWEMDSIYAAYKAKKYALRDNERDLFGMQAVNKLGLTTPTCINYSSGRFDFDTVQNFAKANGQNNILDAFNKRAAAFMEDADRKLTELTLTQFLLYINSAKALQQNLSLYTEFLTKIGKDSSYTGTNLVADWYSTNLHIYSNILRVIKPSDKRIVVLFGQGHIPILKHLFSNNTDFEIVEVSDLLK